MSVWAAVLLTSGIAAQRLLGMFVLGQGLERRPTLRRLVELTPAGVIAAVVAQLTFGVGQRLQIDARLAGVAVAALLVWRGFSLAVVVVGAAVVAGGLRALGAS